MCSFIVFIKHFVSIAHLDKLQHFILLLIRPQIHVIHIQEDKGLEEGKKGSSSALRVHRGHVPRACRTSLITRKWGRKPGLAWGRESGAATWRLRRGNHSSALTVGGRRRINEEKEEPRGSRRRQRVALHMHPSWGGSAPPCARLEQGTMSPRTSSAELRAPDSSGMLREARLPSCFHSITTHAHHLSVLSPQQQKMDANVYSAESLGGVNCECTG